VKCEIVESGCEADGLRADLLDEEDPNTEVCVQKQYILLVSKSYSTDHAAHRKSTPNTRA
jgi:hypothetical protein